MAESYRGLTIKIGGDTTELKKALHTAEQAASGTQSTMRKLSDALKMDPTSLKAAQLQVGAFAAQASNAASRMVTLNDAMQQVGDRVMTFNGSAATVRELAASWSNVNMVASQTRDYYKDLTATLATTYTEFSKTYSEASKMASIDVAKGLKLDYGNFEDMSVKLQSVADAFNANGRQVDSFLVKIQKVSQRYDELCEKQAQYQEIVDQGDVGSKEFEKAVTQLAKVNSQLEIAKTRFSGVVDAFKGFDSKTLFRNDSSNTDLASLAKSLYQMVEAEAMTAEQADKMWDSFARMKSEWESAFENVKTANVVEGLDDAGAESEKATAKVKSLVDELVRLSNTSDVAKGMVALKQQFNEITTASSTAQQRLESILKLMSEKRNEGNTSLQSEALREYNEVVAQTQLATQNAEERLSHYDETIQKLATSTRSYAAETAAANKEYEESAAALKGYEGAMESIQILQNDIKKDNPSHYEDDEDYQALEQTLEAMNVVLEQLKAKFKDASAEKDKFVQIGEVRELYNTLEQLHDKAEAFTKIKPEIDVSALGGIQKMLDALSKGDIGDSGITKFRQETEGIAASLSEAKKRYEALKAASKEDPTNSETTRQRLEAANQVVALTKQHITALKQEIASIPSDKINKAAIESGKVGQAYKEAKERVEEFAKGIGSLEERIKILKEKIASVESLKGGDPEALKALNEQLKALKQELASMQIKEQEAFDNLVIQENTRHVQENTTAIQQDEAALKKYGDAAKGLDIEPPKIDKAAFMQVVTSITQSVRRMGQEVIQSSDEIDKAFRDMTKTVNAGEEQLNQLKDTAIEYSQTHITSADTMLEMQALGGQLGIAAENLEQFGKIASNLDIATDIDAETIALKLGQISNILDLDIDGMEGFSDALVRLGNNMPAQESAIMAVAQRFGAVATTASFSGDEVLAWSAAIAATGQRSEAAATAISNTVSGIEQAVANGGNDLKQFAAIASMSAEEFKQSWKDSPTETLRAFIQGLETLKDSDESAVAALENMGITGVRQQQTLLALTQTIDNLDDALLMSSDAWNGISDQWGNAGDAANEADKKSQGFSGALAIMQNNAQNLGATLGDALIPFMNIASDLMRILTDVLNSMSPTLKTITVAVGGFGIAFGTVIPMLETFTTGMGALISAAGSTSSIGTAVTQVLGLGTALEGTAGSATLLGSAMGGPLSIGVMAAVGALAYGISLIADYYAEQEELRQATEGLVTAMENSEEAYNTYISGADDSTRSVKDLRDAIDDATRAQADYAKQLEESWGEIGTKEATVDTYVKTIDQLADKSNLSAEEQKKLALAVEAYNNLTGDSVHIIDAQRGVLDKGVEAIDGTADAWKNALENEQYIKQYGDAVYRAKEQEDLLNESNAKLSEKGTIFEEMGKAAASSLDNYDSLGDILGNTGALLLDMGVRAGQAAKEYYDLDVSVTKASADLKSNKDIQEETIEKMSDAGNPLAPVEDAFQAVGRSLTEYGTLTNEECDVIMQAFNDSSDTSVSAVDRVINAMKAFRAGAGNAAEIASQLEEASKEAIKERYNAAKAKFKEEYNDLKRQLDADYKAQQRAFDQEYKAQQKAYDAEYKAQQKAYDAEYKARQKEYDKQYKALQKKLDNEYKARKKAYDDQLKALKKSQSDEVDAFKKATDAKLKEMEREYKQRVKNLELQYGGQTDDIDEQIKQLKGETEAEKKAIEERKENEKIGELQKEVDRAKSRRKRAEAEKALNDYLTEIEQKRNEESREAQITQLEERKDQLKDELADRKEQLKAEYDAEVEAYKERRAAELEAMQEANTLEYEAKQEYYNTQLEQLKEAQTAQLETTKEAQQAALESLKESQQASLEALKESQQEQLEALKESQQIALENMKNDHNMQLEQTKAHQDAMLAEIKKGNTGVEEEQDRHAKETGEAGKKSRTLYAQAIGPMPEDAQNVTKQTKEEFFSNLNVIPGLAGKTSESTRDEFFKQLNNMPSLAGKNASNVSGEYRKSLEGPLKDTVSDTRGTMRELGDELDKPATWASDSGDHAGRNYWTGFSAWSSAIVNEARYIAEGVAAYIQHSVPKKGPLHDDDKWGGHLVQNLIDGMQDKEHNLFKQAKRMADIVEEGFDPTLTVDAAYEAIDTINQRRSSALSTMVESKNTPNISINLNMNLSNVNIRDDSDIEKLAKVMSQEMATQAARQLAGRLG